MLGTGFFTVARRQRLFGMLSYMQYMPEYRAQTISTGEMDDRLGRMLEHSRAILKEALKSGKDTTSILEEIDRITRAMDA